MFLGSLVLVQGSNEEYSAVSARVKVTRGPTELTELRSPWPPRKRKPNKSRTLGRHTALA